METKGRVRRACVRPTRAGSLGSLSHREWNHRGTFQKKTRWSSGERTVGDEKGRGAHGDRPLKLSGRSSGRRGTPLGRCIRCTRRVCGCVPCRPAWAQSLPYVERGFGFWEWMVAGLEASLNSAQKIGTGRVFLIETTEKTFFEYLL